MKRAPARRGACGWMLIALALWAVIEGRVRSEAADAVLKVTAQPLNNGRINPMLFGNFIELLNDLCPGMWAEMLNDRGFEGVIPPAKWVYYDGSPTFCDRTWDQGNDWTLETTGAFNGPRCARIAGSDDRAIGLTQSGLAVKPGTSYRFSTWLHSDVANLRVQAVLKSALADGRFAELASADLPAPTSEWSQYTAELVSHGGSDRAAFELRVVGKGTLWADKLSLMPAESVGGELNGWRKDVVEAIKASHPAVIRWGGSAVDPGAYRWKNGIGDRDRRVPFENVNWGRIDSNDVGIDEFCQVCVLAIAEPLVCVSFSDGAQSAADLVEYCNGPATTQWGARRAANGHPAPYGVKYWQLGNEISGNDEAYIKKCTEFIRVMKRADPSIAILSSFPSQKVLDVLGKDLAYLAPHHYTRDLAACEADFKKLARMIAHTPGCGHLRLAVTEWNFTGGDWGLMRGKMLTLDGAILNARYLNLLCRYSNLVDIACRSNMTNSFASGIIETNGGGVLRRPSYYVMQLYSEHALPIPLAVRKASPHLDVIACTDGGRREACVFAVNSNHDPVNVSLDLGELGAGFAPLEISTVCDTLDMRQPDVMNHWAVPDRVRTLSRKLTSPEITLPALSVSAISCARR
ncbi:MAG TPA: alpha-L-arabinofuranosidase C-terminal domain-containing protein [Planctomycetaceae bacterium]|nr:alpha-L-arabinofuranosidase C-terminal domain-containing protein [Planctomycetaceae bacterium]